MSKQYLHNHPEFDDLIRIIANEMDITPKLIEKDYWIMHCLYGLQILGKKFYLKGGTSLSKGFKRIDRFSEDIDILIEPPDNMNVAIGRNQNKQSHCESRQKYYDWLAQNIKIDGVENVQRDTYFDDEKYRSGGIRLSYPTAFQPIKGVKEGILLEVGFDNITPNMPITISSWAYDYAVGRVDIKDNRAIKVHCYHPGYTLVEKLQTISTKYRKHQESGVFLENFMRHYYDVYCLLGNKEILGFLGTQEYINHKMVRFRESDIQDIKKNKAFQMDDPPIYSIYEKQYEETKALYYKERPSFRDIINRIKKMSEKL